LARAHGGEVKVKRKFKIYFINKNSRVIELVSTITTKPVDDIRCMELIKEELAKTDANTDIAYDFISGRPDL